MRNKSPANSADSSPPAPALISKITSRSSLGSRGNNNSSSAVSVSCNFASSAGISDAKSGSSAAISLPAAKSSVADFQARYPAITGPIAA